MKENIYDKIFDYPCAVCDHILKVDCYKQGKCEKCGWENDFISTVFRDKNPIPVFLRTTEN